MIQKYMKAVLAIALVLLISPDVFAQGPPPKTPIDGGLSLLLAAGGIYGIKKIRRLKKGT